MLLRLGNIFKLFAPTILLIVSSFTSQGTLNAQKDSLLKGVNLSGAEFGEASLPGVFGIDYTYPNEKEIDYFIEKGMNLFRIGFRWERLQQEKFANLNVTELSRLNEIVEYATSKGAHVLLNPHNYSRYFGDIVGSSSVTTEAFANFWAKLADEYKDNPNVMFGLVNEPHDMSTEVWRDNANAAIAAIREAGATNLITVPGNGWTGAHSWTDDWYGTPNAEAMLEITDPIDNMAFEVHQYLDSNSEGSSPNCVSATIGSERLKNFTDWLKENDKIGFLAEFGGAYNETCMAAVNDMLEYIDENEEVWMAWAWWAAGPWWGSDYFLSIEPVGGIEKPQMAVLEEHIGDNNSTDNDSDNETTTSNEDKDELPAEISLEQNYPNPFNPSTDISYTLPEKSQVTLTVYNMLGQQVVELVNTRQAAGFYSVTFNAGALSSGTYFYRLHAGNKTLTKKMLLVK